jgi:coproporphyrinogen dehydrogenase HemZ
LSDISISFNKRDFEYDVYTLVKAFYPGKEITTFYTDENTHPAEAFLKLDVSMYDDHIDLTVDEKNKDKISASVAVPENDRKERKNILKRLIYETLADISGQKLPWGTLTGIRPTKIPMALMEEGLRNPDIAKYMREVYCTSPKKTALAIAVANREKEILDRINPEEGYSLYVGIPFCPSICLYCSFGSHPYDRWGKFSEEYLSALFKELDYIASKMKNKKLQTIYIGGGTPTTLNADQLERLLLHIRDSFDMKDVMEFTVEAGRPDTVDLEKMEVLIRNGVDRVSINPQTMNQKTLDTIGRNHTVEQVVTAFDLARKAGFKNINMDIIVGLPGEGLEEVKETLKRIKELHPDSLTVHSLALKRATRLNLFKDVYTPVSFENSQEIMDLVDIAAMEMGMEPYYMYRQKNMAGNLENIGYAVRGCFGIYNILIMEEKQSILAAGSGASSKFVFADGRIERAENVKDIKNYIERIDEMLTRKEKYLKCN